ncbi:rhomboid domain-containing protein 2 [Syngnathoides biaculeatus]|uniref:rhomboid domain-containing protein 2 n=1 Tax=Syngnathoides biaculeatus TaxID=300417 RepID=UPI002ADDBC11|nr:rhomboid domain-containing protein 2 [Syngnathoides biaculeatus]
MSAGHVRRVLGDVVPAVTSGILLLSLTSCAVFALQRYLDLSQGSLSVGASVFLQGHVHTLFTFPFHHRTATQLLLGIWALLFLGGSLEKAFGTVRFLSACFVMSTIIGLSYALLDLLLGRSGPAEGLVPMALACVAVTTTHTKMAKGFLCGVTFPAVVLPWAFVLIAGALIPRTALPCGVVATLVGWMHGRGCFSLLDLSEVRAGLVEKTAAFRSLRSIRVAAFVPASAAERRKTLLPQINPTPGSYPVQAYAPASCANVAVGGNANMVEGWSNAAPAASGPAPFPDPQVPATGVGVTSHGHNCAHNHGQL